jgi:hypothetical protein
MTRCAPPHRHPLAVGGICGKDGTGDERGNNSHNSDAKRGTLLDSGVDRRLIDHVAFSSTRSQLTIMKFARFAKNQIERTNGKTLWVVAARRTRREGGPVPSPGKAPSLGCRLDVKTTIALAAPGRWQGCGVLTICSAR